MKLIIRNISVHTFSVAFFRHYVSTLSDNARILIHWKYAEAEIVIRRNVIGSPITDSSAPNRVSFPRACRNWNGSRIVLYDRCRTECMHCGYLLICYPGGRRIEKYNAVAFRSALIYSW